MQLPAGGVDAVSRTRRDYMALRSGCRWIWQEAVHGVSFDRLTRSVLPRRGAANRSFVRRLKSRGQPQTRRSVRATVSGSRNVVNTRGRADSLCYARKRSLRATHTRVAATGSPVASLCLPRLVPHKNSISSHFRTGASGSTRGTVEDEKEVVVTRERHVPCVRRHCASSRVAMSAMAT